MKSKSTIRFMSNSGCMSDIISIGKSGSNYGNKPKCKSGGKSIGKSKSNAI